MVGNAIIGAEDLGGFTRYFMNSAKYQPPLTRSSVSANTIALRNILTLTSCTYFHRVNVH